MKNSIASLLLCVFLAGCIRAGDYDLMPVRSKILNSVNGISIEFNEGGEEFIASQALREHDYTLNKAITVQKGDAILSDKTFNKDTYRTWIYRPNKKGAINNHAFPMKLDNKKEYDVVGWSKVDGVRYSLLDSGLDDYVFLFDEHGNFYNKAGKIDDGVLKILDEEIFVYPSDVKMQTIAKMRDEVSNIKNGYEVKYGGVKLDRIWFDYMDYDQDYNSGGEFEKISFPNKPGLIMLNGKGLRVLKADKDTITYMVLTDEE
ncbi:MAG: hypothetical protein E7020_01635 [Alphaproteobacteria bacterium]|nr:hypothetical protein [Alphaproteobacteria bacterium]